jgi:hypothetical protein
MKRMEAVRYFQTASCSVRSRKWGLRCIVLVRTRNTWQLLDRQYQWSSAEAEPVPTDNSSQPNCLLLHVHVCIHCANPFRREEVEGRVHTTGLFLCPKCEVEGPLNIEIREVDDDESQMLRTE